MSDGLSHEVAELCELPAEELERALAELVREGAEAVHVLQELEQCVSGKDARKRVRRALHQLRSRGVTAEAPGVQRGASVLRPLARREEEGTVSQLDPLGRRMVCLLVPDRAGARLYEAVLSDSDGVISVRRYDVRLRAGRSFLRELRQHPDQARQLGVPGGEVRELVRRARALCAEPPSGREASWLEEMMEGDEGPTPGGRLREKLAGGERPSAAVADAALAARIEAERLPPWPLAGPEIAECARELAEADTSPLVLSPAQQQERRAERVAEVAAAVFTSETRERLAARLEETAVFWQDEGDDEGVRAALAVAERVRGGDPPESIDLLRRLLDLSLEIAGRQAAEEQEGKLIVPG
jgi:hypothetical protein